MENKILNAIKDKRNVNALGIKDIILNGVLISLYQKELITKDNKFTSKGEKLMGLVDDKKTKSDDKPEIIIFSMSNISKELDLDPKKIRKILRDNKIQKDGKHYQWKTQKEYDEVKALINKSLKEAK